MQLSRAFRAIYRGRLASLLTATSLILGTVSPLNVGAAPLPDVDPTREWRGSAYADVLYTRFKNIYPQIPLTVDHHELNSFVKHKEAAPWTVKQALAAFQERWTAFKDDPLKERFMGASKSVFSPALAELIHSLEFGDRIFAVDPTAAYHQEAALQKWVENQKDNSIYPDDLMIEALRLNNGRVVSAWMTAWNLTRNEWEYASTRNYSHLRAKFKSLTGERHLWQGAAHYQRVPEDEQVSRKTTVLFPRGDADSIQSVQRMKMVITKRGDEYSYLYHRIGVELLSIVVASQTQSSLAGWGLGTLGALGEFVKYTKTAGLARENKKRIANDLAAASSGARFYSLVNKKTKPPLTMGNATASHYLRSNNWKYGKSYQLPPSVPAHLFGADVVPTDLSRSMTSEELKLRFHHSSHYDSNVLDPIVLTTGEDYERLHRGLADYIASGARDPELNLGLRQFAARVTAAPEIADVVSDLNLIRYANQRVVSQSAPDFSFDEAEKKLLIHVTKAIAAADAFQKKREILRLLRPPVEMCRAAFGS